MGWGRDLGKNTLFINYFERKRFNTMADEKKSMQSLMTEGRTFPPPANIQANAHIKNPEVFKEMWERSINDPDKFWLEQAKADY